MNGSCLSFHQVESLNETRSNADLSLEMGKACTHYADGRKLTCFAVAHAAADSLLPLLRHLLVGLGLRDLRTFLLTESCEELIK